MSFIKKNFISKKKSGTVTRVKLVTKIKKHNQPYFGTLILQFVIFKPLSNCFEETIGLDVKASFVNHPISRLIR